MLKNLFPIHLQSDLFEVPISDDQSEKSKEHEPEEAFLLISDSEDVLIICSYGNIEMALKALLYKCIWDKYMMRPLKERSR